MVNQNPEQIARDNADYVLFVEGKPCGVIEPKKEDEAYRLNIHENQGQEYVNAKLKHLN